jgi:hypothetical protein
MTVLHQRPNSVVYAFSASFCCSPFASFSCRSTTGRALPMTALRSGLSASPSERPGRSDGFFDRHDTGALDKDRAGVDTVVQSNSVKDTTVVKASKKTG